MEYYNSLNFKDIQDIRSSILSLSVNDIPETVSGIRPIIYDSWKRSIKSTKPDMIEPKKLSPAEYEKALKENAILLSIAMPYLTDVFSFIKNTSYVINFTDAHGYQLKEITGNVDEHGKINSNQHGDGTDYSEASMGTTGIGLSLYLDEPVTVYGPEHFQDLYQNLICYGAPIHDDIGRQIGCLNITGPFDDYNPLLMSLLLVAVNGIEKEYKLMQMNQTLNTIISNDSKGIILLDSSLRIMHCNESASAILKIHGLQTHHLLSEYIVFDFSDDSTDILDRDVSILNSNGVLLDLSVTVHHISEPTKSTIFSFTTQEYTHSLANQIAGFSADYTFDSIYGHSAAVSAIKRAGKNAANTSLPILIIGEEGTGKDILAQSIHNAGAQSNGPFVSVNCETMPSNSLRKELLGDGSLSPGKLTLSKNGTLFIDHIDSLPEDLQQEIFNYMQTDDQYAKPRLIASTTGNLYSDVQAGLFRPDLYYYLNMTNIVIPPLREHSEDIPESINMMMQQMKDRNPNLFIPVFDHESISILMNYKWPGNNRELASVVDRILKTHKNEIITAADLPSYIIRAYYIKDSDSRVIDDALNLTPETAEYRRIHSALKAAKGNVKLAASSLNMPASTLYRKAAKFNIIAKDYK